MCVLLILKEKKAHNKIKSNSLHESAVVTDTLNRGIVDSKNLSV